MKKYTIPLTLLLFSCLSANETGNTSHQMPEPAPTECGERPRPIRLALRHIEANGIGYSEGYTTIEGFLTPIYPNKWLCLKDQWLPFADVRLHIFNDGEPAVNAGLGIRYLASHMVWGANAYYDFRKTSHQNYNQVALGFEGLGRIWDWRINGYLPVGDTSWYSKVKFEGFEGNSLIISQKHQFALKGFNAEAGIHISEFKNKRIGNLFSKTPFYVAAGPYYLAGHGKSSWGAEARFTLDLYEYVRLEGNTSYDNIFHGIGQGQLTVQIPLGRKKKVYARKGESCGRALAMSERAVQRVDRNEIIPIKKEHIKSPAIDPATGEPYYFLFVNNTSHSAGTYESPYPTLLMAQNASSPNDVIYVFPGDGTDFGMNVGITLKDNQRFLSTSIAYPFTTTKGVITVPAMTTGLPLVTNTGLSDQPVVFLANNNEVLGFSIHDVTFSSDGAIVGGPAFNGNITNVIIGDCTIVNDNSNPGINLESNTNLGSVAISNCTFSAGTIGVLIEANSQVDSVTISNCTIADGSYGIGIDDNDQVNVLTISDCTVSSYYPAISIVYNTDIETINIANSVITSHGPTFGDALDVEDNTNIGTLNVSNCTIVADIEAGVYFRNNDTIGNVVFSGGSVTSQGSDATEAVSFYQNTDINAVTFQNYTVTGVRNGLSFVSDASAGDIVISNCNIIAGTGNGIEVVSDSLFNSANISNCQISVVSSSSIGIHFDSMNSTNPVTISNCTISAPNGPYGVSFTNTPDGFPPFRLNLLSNTITNPPPGVGYYVSNPEAQADFVLEANNNIGTTSFNNVTIVP